MVQDGSTRLESGIQQAHLQYSVTNLTMRHSEPTSHSSFVIQNVSLRALSFDPHRSGNPRNINSLGMFGCVLRLALVALGRRPCERRPRRQNDQKRCQVGNLLRICCEKNKKTDLPETIYSLFSFTIAMESHYV